MNRYRIMCLKQDGESGIFDDHACRFRWKTGANILTMTELGMVCRGLGGVDRGTGTRPASLPELFKHLGSPQVYAPMTSEDIPDSELEGFDDLDEAAQSILADGWDNRIAAAPALDLAKFEATVTPKQGSAVLPKTHPEGAKQAEDNAAINAAAEAEQRLKDNEIAEKVRIAEENKAGELARELMAKPAQVPKPPKPEKVKKPKKAEKKGGKK